MKKFVVDTSVAVKWFVPEIHSESASRLLVPDVGLCAPDLLDPELGSTLWKKVRTGELTHEQAIEILAAFDLIPFEIFTSKVLLAAAFQIARTLDRTVYDSIFLSLAVAQNCALVTADRRFHSVVAASPLADHILWVDDVS